MRAVLLVLLLGCGGEAEIRSEPAPAAGETVVEPSAEEPAVREPEAPAVDLLHAVPTRVRSSSAYRDDVAQVAKLFDGDLATAWNSRTGDLVGAWIEVTLPDDARVTEIQMTVGFPHEQRGRDLFTGNHRVRQVRVSRGESVLGTFELDVESRELQPIAIESAGGTLRITVTEVAAGTQADWRETCISELRVMGRAPGAEVGAHTPVASFEAAQEEAAAPEQALAEPIAAPAQATD